MLVLSRRPEEKIVLPTVPAVVKVISAQAGLVRLGIDAPKDVPILREEIATEPAPRSAPRYRVPVTAASGLAMRHRLNKLILGVRIVRQHLGNADVTGRDRLDQLEAEIRELRQMFSGRSEVDEPAEGIEVLL